MNTSAHCPSCGKPLPPNSPQGLCPECLMKAGFATGASPAPSAAGRGRSAFVAPSPAELAPHFPQLEIVGLVGQGGMGAVYRARQPALDRMVALKILAPHIGEDPSFAERFTREARALARLNHPHIVGVHDFGEAGGFHYLMMEYVDGTSLRAVMEAGPMAPKEALAIVPALCEALQFAHDRGIVHRDIKPENILLARDGTVKLADFGLAKLAGAEPTGAGLTGAGDIMGTPHYMAPEQIERPAEVDHRADIYSLGVVFYQMLTGELPLGRFAPPSQRVRVDVRLDEVVLRTLEKEPERRYQQAREVKTEVETIASGAPPPVQAVAATSAAAPFSRANVQAPVQPRVSKAAIWGAVWIVFACVVAAGVVLTWFATGRERRGIVGPAELAIMTVPFTLLALCAPIGATVLGWTAAGRIRRSQGRVTGLGLAVFDGLFFPLAGANAVLVLLAALVADSMRPESVVNTMVVAVCVVGCVLLDVLVPMFVWRRIKRVENADPRRVQGGAGESGVAAGVSLRA